LCFSGADVSVKILANYRLITAKTFAVDPTAMLLLTVVKKKRVHGGFVKSAIFSQTKTKS
jgi:hypothetical protein